MSRSAGTKRAHREVDEVLGEVQALSNQNANDRHLVDEWFQNRTQMEVCRGTSPLHGAPPPDADVACATHADVVTFFIW